MKQIVGILLIKNEDLHIEWVIRNIFDFCDHIIVLDNNSTDDTYAIVERLAAAADKIDLRKWKNPRDSQRVLAGYYGTDTWVFGVDGDEVYDPGDLSVLRKRLFAGEFDHIWRLRGNFLNCVRLDINAQTAEGYPAPPAMQSVKLYNFKLISGWKDEHRKQRLHGYPIFAENQGKVEAFVRDISSWKDPRLKCLHLCFIPRSSRDEFKQPFRMKRLKRWLRGKAEKTPHTVRPNPRGAVEKRMQRYACGEIVGMDISSFLGHKPKGLDDDFTLPASDLGAQLRQGGNIQLPAALHFSGGGRLICTQLIKRYRNERVVLKGQWQGRPVLVKFLTNKRGAQEARLEQNGHRILTWLKIKTPRLYFTACCDGGYVLVFEFLDGQTLAELWRTSPHRRAEIADFCIDLFRKLHRNGYRHVDVTPANFMFAEDTFYVIDAHGVQKPSRQMGMGTLFSVSKRYGAWQRHNLAQCLSRPEKPLYDAMMDALKRKYPEAANDAKLEPAIIARAKLRAERRATARIRRLFRKAGYLVWREK